MRQDGTSFAHAIVMHVEHQADSPAAEWAWIEQHYPDARPAQPEPSMGKNEEVLQLGHALLIHDGKTFDALTAQLPDGTERTFYFDISDSFGK